MKLASILVALCMTSCGGPNFSSEVIEDTTDAEATDSNPSLSDSLVSSPDAGRADERGGFESDAGSDATDATDSTDANRDPTTDAWPTDIILEPYCQSNEVYPAYSPTCYQWGAEHGWTIPGCCLPDHTCGTVRQGMCLR